MLSEEFIAAVEKAFTVKGFDLKVEFNDIAVWDEAVFHTQTVLSSRGIEHVAIHDSFKVEYLLENGNVITLVFSPSPHLQSFED